MSVVFDHNEKIIFITRPVTFAELMAHCMMFCKDYAEYKIETTLFTVWGENVDVIQELKWLSSFTRNTGVCHSAN